MSLREFDLIDRYFSGLGPDDSSVKCGIGDDAAVLGIPADQELLVSVDTLVSNVHFLDSSDAGDIGYKALAVNISDIAAMGGTARWATLALTLPRVDPDWIEAFARGFAGIANKYNVCLIGGDTTRGPLSITVQIMGTVYRGQSLRRKGATAGDLIYVSGDLGSAGLARACAENSALIPALPAACLERLQRPEPRLELGQRLCGLASAAIDISDGLVADLGHILKSSEVAAQLQLAAIPRCAALAALDDKQLSLQIALAAGDDYELCFTLPADKQAELEEKTKQLEYPLTCIGKIIEGEGLRWIDENNKAVNLSFEGYQHFV